MIWEKKEIGWVFQLTELLSFDDHDITLKSKKVGRKLNTSGRLVESLTSQHRTYFNENLSWIPVYILSIDTNVW